MIIARAEIWHNNLIDWSVNEVRQLIFDIKKEFKKLDVDGWAVMNSTTIDYAKSGRTTVITLEPYDQVRHPLPIPSRSSSFQEYYRNLGQE